jgi:hypothetical protein
MDWFDHGIRCGCQEAVDLVWPRNRLGLGATVTVVGRPDAGAIEPGTALTRIWRDLWGTIDMLNALRASLRLKLPARDRSHARFF